MNVRFNSTYCYKILQKKLKAQTDASRPSLALQDDGAQGECPDRRLRRLRSTGAIAPGRRSRASAPKGL